MRWGTFIIFGVVAVVLDTSFMQVLRIGQVVPCVSATLAVFIAMSAPRTTALWAALLLGLALDATDMTLIGREFGFHLFGPFALGFFFGGNLVLGLRGLMLRYNPLTIGFLVMVFMFCVTLVRVMIWTIRSWYSEQVFIPWAPGGPLDALWNGILVALYSGLLAVIPVGWLLQRSAWLWGFQGVAVRPVRA